MLNETDSDAERSTGAVFSIDAPHFNAGVIVKGKVTKAAPILRYMMGWPESKVRAYAAKKGWSVTATS
jgi:hypothetical protein